MIGEVKATPTTDQFAQIGFFVGTIDSSGQGDELVRAFREVFGKPNVAVLVGTPLLQKAVDRELTRQEPVRPDDPWNAYRGNGDYDRHCQCEIAAVDR